MNIALIGCGQWGKNIYRVLREYRALYCVYDENKVDSVFSINSLNAVLSDAEVDGVVIATPAPTHFDIAKMALEAGKHVLVEKPFVFSSADAHKLIDLAEQQKKILMVGHLLHYHPAIIKLKELIAEGILGDLQYIYSHRLNYGRIRKEENVWWSFAPHDISVILSLFGKPKSVTAFGADFINKGIADTTLTVMDFGGKVAHIHVSWLHPFKEQRLTVIGAKASIVFDGVSNELMLYQNWDGIMIGESVDFEKAEPLLLEIEHFIDCIKTGKQPITDGREGLRVVEILEKAAL